MMRLSTTPHQGSVRAAWGIQCPVCQADEHIEIELGCWAALSVVGTDTDAANDGNHYWDEKSTCRCDRCGHEATVADFTVDDVKHAEVQS